MFLKLVNITLPISRTLLTQILFLTRFDIVIKLLIISIRDIIIKKCASIYAQILLFSSSALQADA